MTNNSRKVETALKKQIKAVGLTQIDVSLELGVPNTTLSNWLNGAVNFPDDARKSIKGIITKRLKKMIAEVGV